MRIERIQQFLIDDKKNSSIQQLLQSCFPDYPDHRTYFKQVPNFRLLAWDKKKLIAHAGLEFRIIKVGKELFRVFIIGDICVIASHQHQNIASKLIKEIEILAKNNLADFVLVVVTNPSLYLKNGFLRVNNLCRWVIIQEHTTIGIRQRSINNSLMIKQFGATPWNDGVVDFLGHIV